MRGNRNGCAAFGSANYKKGLTTLAQVGYTVVEILKKGGRRHDQQNAYRYRIRFCTGIFCVCLRPLENCLKLAFCAGDQDRRLHTDGLSFLPVESVCEVLLPCEAGLHG